MNRREYADRILERMSSCQDRLRDEFSQRPVKSFVLDDLLDETLAREIYEAFPAKEKMAHRRSLREQKYVAAQMNQYHPLLEEIVFAFQDGRVVALVSEITGVKHLLPDENLYAGGISLMARGDFLNPHLDNSHDKDRKLYRALNLLYYVTPDWPENVGGNLELWDHGVKRPSRTVHSKFNRLVCMMTNTVSWHSVSRVLDHGQRCCVSNYYFSPDSPEGQPYFHVTSFRGRPEQPLRDVVLQCDNALRSSIRLVFRKGLVKPWHVYQK
jgi:Rps23 Pro-64 3,4-dihydroxylase Tpa1-like proline 4-hydroxylase